MNFHYKTGSAVPFGNSLTVLHLSDVDGVKWRLGVIKRVSCPVNGAKPRTEVKRKAEGGGEEKEEKEKEVKKKKRK